MSHESETTQKAQRPNKHHHYGDRAANPSNNLDFNEFRPPKGQAAMVVPGASDALPELIVGGELPHYQDDGSVVVPVRAYAPPVDVTGIPSEPAGRRRSWKASSRAS